MTSSTAGNLPTLRRPEDDPADEPEGCDWRRQQAEILGQALP
jgi:hypothetical protein